MKVEGNGPGNFVPGILLSAGPANNGNIIKQCAGRISHSVGNSQLNGNEFSFHGTLYNDTNLTNGWPSTAFPGLGVAWDNTGPDALVCISGGTLTNITIAGTITGLLAGAFYIPAGGALTVNGTVNPTVWNVVPAAQTGQ
jgi:hypothetical protein